MPLSAGAIRRKAALLRPPRLWGRVFGPKVLVASVPKAGTNMLDHMLSLFPQLRPGRHLVGLSTEQLVAGLAQIRRGQFWAMHQPPSEAVEQVLEQQDIKVIFLYRDPRDVCVSLFHYILRERAHEAHGWYTTVADDHTRLMMTITGHYHELAGGGHAFMPSISRTFSRRLPWLEHPRCCPIQFEALVGPQGGGSEAAQLTAVAQITAHLGLRLSGHRRRQIAGQIYSSGTATFRRGLIGSWREEMSAEHRATFKETAGQLLIDLGYETDLDW